MTKTVGDFVIERLHEWGVKLMFGYPGDGINGTFAALQRVEGRIGFVQVRHEEMAAFMASAYAKFSGEMGVCISTGGPGASHMVTGLYDAKLDHQAVLAITGQAAQTVRGAHYQQELNLDRLFADVADYVQEVVAPAQARHVIDQACRVAMANRAPCVVVLPADLQLEAMEQPERAHGFVRSGVGYTRPKMVPYPVDLQRAAEVLNAGKKVAVLIGAGAMHAHDEVVAIADVLGAGVAKALLGKAALPDDLPFVTGTIGLLGTEPSSNMMDGCDTLLMVGTSFPWAEFLPKDGQARCVQIDIKAQSLGLRYPSEVNLHGDSAETLAALLPLLERKTERSWRATRRMSSSGGKQSRTERSPRPIQSTRNGSSGRCPRACPPMRSSPATRAVAPTGMRAICASNAARWRHCWAGSRQWARRFLMPSPPSSPIRHGRSSPWSEMARCR